ncbi:MAG: photosynthetic complex assembly protein PuhC [Pseudomonadota bacterium]
MNTQNPPATNVISARAMWSIAILLGAVLCIVAAATWSGRSPSTGLDHGPVVRERALVFEGTLNGSAVIHDANGTLVADYPSGKAVFISTIVRVIDRERSRRNLPLDAPVHLRQREDGHLSIFDPSTGRTLPIAGYGADNVQAFAALLN